MQIKKFFEKLYNWELWKFNVLYAPIAPVWLWYCIKSRSFCFFTPSNPKITFGGFEGEGKREMYELLPPEIIPLTTYINCHSPIDVVLKQVKDSGLRFPFIVKPDVGMKGILFRVIENVEQLKAYHQKMPVEYIAQEKIDHPLEISIFYYRYPWQETGYVSGFIFKELLQVKGDGKKTLKELVELHPRARFRLEEMESRHGQKFDRVIEKDETYFLSFAANHNRGARFVNLKNEINKHLVKIFDELSYNTQFYYGRYDIKTKSIDDLKQGKNFVILEYNGAGAEPNHIYDCGLTIWKAYKIILLHWKALYKISSFNARNGHPYWPFKKGYKYFINARKHFKLLSKIDC